MVHHHLSILTDFPISIRLASLALWQSNDCPRASKATLMNVDKYFMWIHYERLHNHNKAKHNKTVCIFLGIYCINLDKRPEKISPISFVPCMPFEAQHVRSCNWTNCIVYSDQSVTVSLIISHVSSTPVIITPVLGIAIKETMYLSCFMLFCWPGFFPRSFVVVLYNTKYCTELGASTIMCFSFSECISSFSAHCFTNELSYQEGNILWIAIITKSNQN